MTRTLLRAEIAGRIQSARQAAEITDAACVAHQLRQAIGSGDPWQALTYLRETVRLEWSEHVSGGALLRAGREWIVVLQPGLPADVTRRALAHELGHYHQPAEIQGTDAAERWADAFAAALLADLGAEVLPWHS